MPHLKEHIKSDTTCQKLIEAALELFGEAGFAAVSTRAIAKKAEANISSINYYFGGKEGLYKAVIEHIQENMLRTLVPFFEEIEKDLSENGIDKQTADKNMRRAVKAFINAILRSKAPRRWSMIILREQAHPTDAFDIIYEPVMKRIHSTLSLLAAFSSGFKPGSIEAVFKAHSIIGSIIIFMAGRETLFRRLGVKELTEEHLDIIQDILSAAACSGTEAGK